MMQPAAMPLGIVTESTPDGGIMMFTRPNDRYETTCETPVIIKNRDERNGAESIMRGSVTEVTGNQASFQIVEVQTDPNWPAHLDPKGAGNAVYRGVSHDSFSPDMTRVATGEELVMLHEFAKTHEQETGLPPRRRHRHDHPPTPPGDGR